MEKLSAKEKGIKDIQQVEIFKEFEKILDLSKIIEDNKVSIFNKDESALSEIIHNIINENGFEDPFVVLDIGPLLFQYSTCKKILERGTPYYAVRYCKLPVILDVLRKLECGFACTNQEEITYIINNEIHGNRIYFSNPVKDPHHLKFADSKNVELVNFDCENELLKIKVYHPHANSLLKVNTEVNSSYSELEIKYGCSVDEVSILVERAKLFGINFKGYAIQSYSYNGFCDSIDEVVSLVHIAQDKGFQPEFLDLGELEIDTNDFEFVPLLEKINSQVKAHIDKDYEILYQLGKDFFEQVYFLVFIIRGKKIKKQAETILIEYFVDESIFDILSTSIKDKEINIVEISKVSSTKKYPTIFSSCNRGSKDGIKFEHLSEMEAETWCYFQNIHFTNNLPTINIFTYDTS